MRSVVCAFVIGVLGVSGLNAAPATSAPKQEPPGQERPERFFVDESTLPFEPLPGAEAHWGVHAGAAYRIEVPEDWNGELFLYAHGYRADSNRQLTVSNPNIREHLIEEGYAWAASSYRANGYVPGIGAKDTHKLIGLFTGMIANPERVYIGGHSLGGHVTGVAIEQWPNAFDGALPLCGVMGDNALFDYFQDAYLVAETLAGNEPVVPTPDDYATTTWPETRAALGSSFPTGLTEAGEDYKAIIENLTGGDRPIFDEGFVGPTGAAFIFNFGSARTTPMAGNIGTVYQFDDDPALNEEEQAFNDAIVRIAAEPQARRPNGLGKVPGTGTVSPPITGDITIPVLSLHTLGELFVPFSMQQIYAQEVADQGAAELLVTRAIRDTRHCGFTLEEQTAAFDDLVRWVEDGVRPEGDDVLDPETVAEPEFGCRFTSTDRPGLPICP